MDKQIFHNGKEVIFGILLPLILVILGASTAHAVIYYVALTGNDSNPGTIAQPFRSIARGVNSLTAGDTLYLRGGTYTERIDLATPNKTGTPSAWITIAGYTGESVTIRYTSTTSRGYGPVRAWGQRGYFIFDNLILDGVNETEGTKWQIRDGNHHFILRNLEFKNFKSSALYIEADDILITNCSFHDGDETNATLKRFYGIYAHHGRNIVIENSQIYNQPGGGLHLYPGPLTNLIVRGNRIYHNNRHATGFGGIILYGSSTTSITNVQIYNNLVYANGLNPMAGPTDGITIGPYTQGTKLWNNTVYGNKDYGINIKSTLAANTLVQNNIMYGNTKGNYVNTGISTTYDHNLTTNPSFLNSNTFDFRLERHSAGIDGGVNLTEVNTDYRNATRPKGETHDIGAYEDDGSDINSISAPRDLVAR